jgi:thiol-disulfide isomerase/thioredoxin
MPMFRRYVLTDAVPLEKMAQPTDESALMIPGFDVFLGLAVSDGEISALHSGNEVNILDGEEVAGLACHHLSVSGPSGGFEIWIASGERPWVMRHRKEAPEAAEAPEMPEPDESGLMTLAFEPGFDIRFSDWSSDAQPEGGFEIRPPDDFEKVDTLFPPMEEMGDLMGGMGEEHPSVGKPAPDATLAPLEGEPVELAKLKGKVVVLDFWATWCVPCVIELPLVKKVVGEIGEDSVAFFAINRGETKKIVAKFLKERKLELPVVMDHEDRISAAFGVQAMPHLAIIDRAGKVRNVHIGSWPGSEAQLKAEIETLLSEK